MQPLVFKSLVSMTLIVLLLRNGSEAVAGEQKESRATPYERSATARSVNTAAPHVQRRNHSSSRPTEDWRTSYYLHANATPWWPSAPGG